MPSKSATGSTKNWWLVGLGGTAALGALSLLRRWAAPQIFEPTIETRLHVVDGRGIVEADPAGLARAAGVELDQYALASAMQSEEHDDRGRLAVGRAIWNAVRGERGKLARLLMPHGYLGSQTVNAYAATSKPPTARTLELAGTIMVGRVQDFVEGAVQWDAPKAQDRNHLLFLKDPIKYKKYRFDSKAVAARRVAEGKREIWIDGVPETRFWGRA